MVNEPLHTNGVSDFMYGFRPGDGGNESPGKDERPRSDHPQPYHREHKNRCRLTEPWGRRDGLARRPEDRDQAPADLERHLMA